jgi:hypothetical protein
MSEDCKGEAHTEGKSEDCKEEERTRIPGQELDKDSIEKWRAVGKKKMAGAKAHIHHTAV